MILDFLLEEKYKDQRILDEKSDFNIEKYFLNTHSLFESIIQEYNITPRYEHLGKEVIQPLNNTFSNTSS